jgi:hypothetical protein
MKLKKEAEQKGINTYKMKKADIVKALKGEKS